MAAFLGWPLLLEFAASLAHGTFYDRYLLPLVPAAVVLGLSRAGGSRASRWVLCGAIAGFAACSWLGTFDYLRVSEAAWSLGDEATKRGYPPEAILASTEWSWSHVYQRRIDVLKAAMPPDAIRTADWVSSFIRPQAVVSLEVALAGASILDARVAPTPLRRAGSVLRLYALPPPSPGG